MNSSRDTAIDSLRTVACLLVVLLHVAATYVEEFIRTSDLSASFWIANVVDSFTRVSVPLFVMISGRYLLASQDSVGVFYRKRLSNILILLIVWTLVYAAYTMVQLRYYLPQQSWQEHLRRILGATLAGKPYYHLWYLFMLPGLYLITPLLKPLLQSASMRVLLVVIAFGVGMYINFFDHPILSPYPLFWFLEYVGYYLAGYVLHVHTVRVHPVLLVSLFVVMSMATAVLTYQMIGTTHPLMYYNYVSPTVLLASLAFYQIFNQWQKGSTRLASFATDTLGIYLVHAGVLSVILSVLGFFSITVLDPVWIGIPVKFMIVVVLSLVIVRWMKRMPLLRRIV
jgi:surface polysaccharide O-acyltransferase-like enzyme